MKRAEQSIQIYVFKYLRYLMVRDDYSSFLAFQVRNETGVKNGAYLGSLAKDMGTMAGVSDVIFVFPKKIVFVEFKVKKKLKKKEKPPEDYLEDAQELFKARVEALGFDYKIIVAESKECAMSQIVSLLKENNIKC